MAWPELPAFGVLMALLDADQRVEMMVTNPERELVLFPDRIERPGIPRPVRGVALFSVGSPDADEPVSPATVFADLRRRYREAGIRFVDWVQIDLDEGHLRSLRMCVQLRSGTATDYLRAGTCV